MEVLSWDTGPVEEGMSVSLDEGMTCADDAQYTA